MACGLIIAQHMKSADTGCASRRWFFRHFTRDAWWWGFRFQASPRSFSAENGVRKFARPPKSSAFGRHLPRLISNLFDGGFGENLPLNTSHENDCKVPRPARPVSVNGRQLSGILDEPVNGGFVGEFR